MPRPSKAPNVVLPKLSDNARIIFTENVMAALKKRGTIGRATFVKKDGSLRTMRFIISQSQSYEAKGSEVAARTMANNPHLFRAIDLDIYRAAKKSGADKQSAMSKAFRQINALTLREVSVNGAVIALS
jgi:hypothetical protein